MSEALIASLQKRIDDLTGQVAQLNAEGKTRRIENKRIKAELEDARGQVAALTTQRDTLQNQANAGPAELQAQVADLQGKLLARDHRDAFGGVKEFSVKGEDGKESKYTLNKGVSVDDLWTALGYKAEGETPDAAKVSGLLSGAVATKPYLFAPASGETPTNAAGAATTAAGHGVGRPGPGASRSVTLPPAERPSASSVVAADYAKTGRTVPGRL